MKVGIIGGGASGIVAAIVAAQNGANVTLIEHMPRIGKKMLLTGSGKCNISNVDMNLKHFHSENKAFVESIFNECPPEETLSFLRSIGLYTKVRNGYYYPYSEQASSVLDVLRFKLRDLNVNIITDLHVKEVIKCGNNFKLKTSDKDVFFDSVVLCCGSNAYKSTGSDGSGFDIGKKLGHRIVKPLSALTYINGKENFYSSIAGIRTHAGIKIFSNGEYMGMETGELQITKTGISGIPVFNLSYIVSKELYKKNKVTAVIDFLPDINKDELEKELLVRKEVYSNRILEEYLSGVFHKNIGNLVLKNCGLKINNYVKELSNKDITNICGLIKEFEICVDSCGDSDHSQVIAGGIDTREISDKLESKLVQGVFFAGEIMDVNGDCGGYNLTWAICTGILAGRNCVI